MGRVQSDWRIDRSSARRLQRIVCFHLNECRLRRDDSNGLTLDEKYTELRSVATELMSPPDAMPPEKGGQQRIQKHG